MGGTAAKLAAKGRPLLFVDLCDGEPTRYADPGQREQQAFKAASILGVDRVTLPLRELYDALLSLTPGAVVALNRAIAVAELRGPEAGRSVLRALTSDTKVSKYPFFWGALADLEQRAGDTAEARKLYGRALSLTRSDAERISYERKLELLPD
jgi:predicted RNA polymerase sigma factor